MGRNRFRRNCLIVTVAPVLCCMLTLITGATRTPSRITTGGAAATEGVDDRDLASLYGVGEGMASHDGEMRQTLECIAHVGKSVTALSRPASSRDGTKRQVAAGVPDSNQKLMGREQNSAVPTKKSQPDGVEKVADRNYYRLEEGKIWTYRISMAGEWGIFLPAVRARVRNLGRQELNGHKVTPQIYTRLGRGSPVRFYSGFAAQDEKGVYEIASQTEFDREPKMNKPPRYVIRYPIKVGTHWQEKEKTWFLSEEVEFVMNYTIRSLDEVVTVPAGTFENCLMLEYEGSARKEFSGLGFVNITVEQVAWFAPAVGLVKCIRKQRGDDPRAGSGGQMTQLLSYE